MAAPRTGVSAGRRSLHLLVLADFANNAASGEMALRANEGRGREVAKGIGKMLAALHRVGLG